MLWTNIKFKQELKYASILEIPVVWSDERLVVISLSFISPTVPVNLSG